VEVALRAGPENQYALSVRDQGVGLPTGFDVNTNDTLGLHLVNILSAQLGAGLSVQSSSQGTTFEVTFQGQHKTKENCMRLIVGNSYEQTAYLDC
jgi:two-component sensor histidine kinase